MNATKDNTWKEKNAWKLNRMIFFVNSVPPILSGVDTLERGSYWFGVLYLLFGLTFIVAGIFIQKLTNKTTVWLQIAGAVLVLITAMDMYMQGKVWLPYAYLSSFVVNSWAIWFSSKKLKNLDKQKTAIPKSTKGESFQMPSEFSGQ